MEFGDKLTAHVK